MYFRLAAIVLLAVTLQLTGCAGLGQSDAEREAAIPTVRALGQEPPWLLEMDSDRTRLTLEYGQRVLSGGPARPVAGDQGARYRALMDGTHIEINVQEALCVDIMSGMTYPQQVSVVLGPQTLSGCGGDPEGLLTEYRWELVALADQALASRQQLTLEFGTTGQFSGQGPCNRFGGSYELTGEGLRLQGLYSTRMACGATRMEQERTLFEHLETVVRFELENPYTLILVGTGDTRLRMQAMAP